tara:strand:+ start:286 stop:882 length:597 start_codon:yes stop_codon:yes gene_type:complete
MKPDYQKAKEKALSILNKLPKNLYYHNTQHSLNVLKFSIKLAKLENISKEDLLLLKTAAIFHDTGYLKQYSNNEPNGAKIAESILKDLNYSKQQIKIIKELILSTSLNVTPKTKLQKILNDADLSNLGTKEFPIKTEALRKELNAQGIKISKEKWNQDNIKFLNSIKYQTPSAKKLFEKTKEENLKKLSSQNYFFICY